MVLVCGANCTTSERSRDGLQWKDTRGANCSYRRHPRAGHTWRLAESVCYGARIADAQVHLIRIDEEGLVDGAGWDMLAVADGIIFGCSTHMGGPSWQFERFADDTIRVWRPTQWRDKLGRRVHQLDRDERRQVLHPDLLLDVAMRQGMVWIGTGMKPAIAYDTAAPRESLNYIGGYGGAMATNPFDNPQDMSPADLATAAAFGQLFATFLAAGNPEHPVHRLHHKLASPHTPALVEGRVDAQLGGQRGGNNQVSGRVVRGVQAALIERGHGARAGRLVTGCSSGRPHRSWRLSRPSGLGPAVGRGGCSAVVGEESDAGKGHLDRGGHVVDVATRLGQDVAALQCGDQTGGQLIGSGVAAELSAGLHPPQCGGDQAAPFGEVAGYLDAVVFVAVGQLGDHGRQHTSERSASLSVGRDQVIAPRVEAGDGGDVGQLLALIGEQCLGLVIKAGTHKVFLVGKVLVELVISGLAGVAYPVDGGRVDDRGAR